VLKKGLNFAMPNHVFNLGTECVAQSVIKSVSFCRGYRVSLEDYIDAGESKPMICNVTRKDATFSKFPKQNKRIRILNADQGNCTSLLLKHGVYYKPLPRDHT
jgi:hypothetical protein